MQATHIVGAYAPFFLVTAYISLIELLRPAKRIEDYLFIILCLCALGWYLTNIVGVLTYDASVARFCVNFLLIFVGLIPPTLLIFVLEFYKFPIKFSRKYFGLLYAIPFITTLLAMNVDTHFYLATRIDVISLHPERDMVIVWGKWFWVHTIYSYILSVLIIGLIVSSHLVAKKFYRLPSTLMLVGVAITLGGNVITVFQIIPPVIDPTLITFGLSIICFNLAIINNNNSRFVRFSRARIYNYLSDFILVLDSRDKVIDFNRSAQKWFSSQGVKLNGVSWELVRNFFEKNGEILQRHGEIKCEIEGSPDNDVDIHLRDDAGDLVLNQRIHEMLDARGDKLGKIIVFTDVTQNRMLIERLETKAGMDILTGMPNRLSYLGARARLDQPEYLPLSVVMCDANGLKKVNDDMGHAQGDMMLQALGKILEEFCPKEGFVARIGGDEFIYLLPRTQQEGAEDFIQRLRLRLADVDGLPYHLSVALGAASKREPGEDLDEVIARADKQMYQDKLRFKVG